MIAAINEANAADEAANTVNATGSATDENVVTAIERQAACWEKVREITRRYAGLPEDFTDVAVTVGDSIVTLAQNRGYEMPISIQAAGVDVWASSGSIDLGGHRP